WRAIDPATADGRWCTETLCGPDARLFSAAARARPAEQPDLSEPRSGTAEPHSPAIQSVGPHDAATAFRLAREGKYLAQPQAGAAAVHKGRRDAALAASALAAPASDPAKAWRVAEHARIGSQPAPCGSEFYARYERRRPRDAARLEPPARRRRSRSSQ